MVTQVHLSPMQKSRLLQRLGPYCGQTDNPRSATCYARKFITKHRKVSVLLVSGKVWLTQMYPSTRKIGVVKAKFDKVWVQWLKDLSTPVDLFLVSPSALPSVPGQHRYLWYEKMLCYTYMELWTGK